MEIITGSTGAAHIQSADDGAFNAAIFGTGNYVLGIGESSVHRWWMPRQ
jgi:hypothetical protein